MGIFRFFLALQVVLTHRYILSGLNLLGGEVEVQSFYVISGFYMALVLNKKYHGKGSYKPYIINRFLRLAPAYWVILFIAVIISPAVVHRWLNHFGGLHITTQLYLVFTSIFLFGQDLILFLRFNPANGMMEFARHFNETLPDMPAAWRFLFNAPSWSLGLQLSFYLIAPFIVRKKTWLITTIMAASFGLRIYLSYYGYNDSNWKYRFFPTELAVFLIGALSYKIYRDLDKIKSLLEATTWGRTLYPKIPYIAVSALCAVLISFQYLPRYMIYNLIESQWFYLLMVCWTIPFIFLLTKNNKTDRFLGELSYPVYLIHWVFFQAVLNPILTKSNLGTEWFKTVETLSIIIVILLSVGFVFMIERPLQKYRGKIFKKARLR